MDLFDNLIQFIKQIAILELFQIKIFCNKNKMSHFVQCKTNHRTYPISHTYTAPTKSTIRKIYLKKKNQQQSDSNFLDSFAAIMSFCFLLTPFFFFLHARKILNKNINLKNYVYSPNYNMCAAHRKTAKRRKKK